MNKWDIPINEEPYYKTEDLLQLSTRSAENGDTEKALKFALELYRREESAEACSLLGVLYGELGRPVASLGYFLCSKHLGDTLTNEQLLIIKNKLRALKNEHDYEVTCEDCYILGKQLSMEDETFQYAIALLQKAATGDPHGVHTLALADAYSQSSEHRKHAERYYKLASQKGCPEFLTRNTARKNIIA